MSTITTSVVLCAIGALYGMFVLINHLKVARCDVSTRVIYAFPIICGTLAWASASYTFYVTGADSRIDMQRILMIVSWCMLARQYRQKYKHCSGRKRR
ncbi:hypothetical protein [Psychrobacter sp. Marseille-P5312]|uniref:hypothetical protein n=1 Tax=Psychrobacter sp. Marseille-P5312 TaxID=2086574 RepID=UPI000CF6BBF3|nr:hypothetical protein [Psychrobacter sp. Marseille-P5312]